MLKQILIVPLLLLFGQVFSQPIFIDQPFQAGDLIVFPHISDSTKYYYLPNKLSLGTTKDGGPQFSFLRYIENVKTTPGGEQRTEGDGGGIVHALVELKVTEQQISRAQSDLRTKLDNDEATIIGPIIYKGGTFALISSFAEEGSEFTEKVIGVGRAPVFVGNKAACSIRLTKLGSKILWESCQTPTPDLSFSFIMDFTGYRSPMNARVEVDWDKVYEHEEFGVGIGVNTGYVGLGVDIKAAFDELREDGTIKVINFGADDQMEAMIDMAYKKVLDMMFAPFKMPDVSEDSTIEELTEGFAEVANSIKQNANVVNINFAYEFKKQKKSGNYVIDLSKSTLETINFRFDENLGSDIRDCTECFRSINLDDPFYKQREILVSVDGLNSEQFAKYINFVTVQMKKHHGNETISFDEQRIAQQDFETAQGLPFSLLYGWKDEVDNDRSKWNQYEYKTVWSFFGDHRVVKDWTLSDQLAINLAPPFHPVEVSVEADPELMKEYKIRVATVKFFYDYGAGEKIERVTLKRTEEIPAKLASFMLKLDEYDYEYEITWRLSGNKQVSSGRLKSSDTLLYVDELPEEAFEE